ncbi:Zinc finger protein CONSTANS-LIKE 1 [Linum grandiflorum]
MMQPSTISEYDLGGEGDLFKAPEPIISEPSLLGLDPMTSALSMISCSGEEILTPSGLEAVDTTIQNEQLYYECKKDLMEIAALNSDDVINIPPLNHEDDHHQDRNPTVLSKSVSSGCLSSMDWISAGGSSFLDFPAGLDFSSAYGMRRAFSEGDIQALSNGSAMGLSHSPRPLIISSSTSDAARKEKLSRYRDKKNRRNFGRKIKYACRKALADSQPRIRGRFAKTEESDPVLKSRPSTMISR